MKELTINSDLDIFDSRDAIGIEYENVKYKADCFYSSGFSIDGSPEIRKTFGYASSMTDLIRLALLRNAKVFYFSNGFGDLRKWQN
jgi:polysaccharide pyruvyl transferase WcaK-like protein